MPGFTLLCRLTDRVGPLSPDFARCFDGLALPTDDGSEQLWIEDRMLLGTTAYAEYPRFSSDETDWRVYLEGRIHNRVHAEVLSELQTYLTGASVDRDRLAAWLLELDGEFVAILLHKPRRRVFLLNDCFARLPVYYHMSSRLFCLSRNIRAVHRLAAVREFDRVAIAHCLLWGYYTQPETYLKNVSRLTPASLLEVDLQGRTWSHHRLHTFNFEDKQQPEAPLKENAAQLATLFADACHRRAASDATNLLSLSGGLDSRSVAAGLRAGDVPFRTASFIDFEQARAPDVQVATRLAELFQVPHRVHELGPPTGENVLTALRLKNGFNYLGVSFLIQYFAALRTEYGAGLRYFSGNGGDRVAQYFRPNMDFQETDQLVQYLVRRRRLFPLDQVCQITRTRPDEILDSLRALLAACPEEDLNQKLVHAELYGDGLSRHLEGEDRNRAFFWTASPFWSVPFFRFIMRIPDHQKQMFRLYREFLTRLSPAAAAVVYPNVNARLGSLRHRMFVLSRDLRWILGRFSQQQKLYTHSPDLLRCLQAQIDGCPAIGDWLSVPALRDVLDKPERCRHESLETLFTVTSIIEDLETGQSSMESFREAVFAVKSDAWEWFKHKPFRASG